MSKGIYKRTKEWREQMSKRFKGQPSPLKGRHISEEHRQNISKAKEGHNVSEETRRKIRETLKLNGYKHSKEVRRRMSEKAKLRKGKDSPNWKGGITPECLNIRHSIEYKLWHKACLERDRFVCGVCGQKGGKLEVHHINNFAEFSELRFALNNGITLCKKCHRKFHKKYGVKNNTQEQLAEFTKVDK